MTAPDQAICPNCGESNPARFRLCGYCGTPLVALPPQEERKTVTIVFSDLKGSTDLGERLDPESLREVMTHYFDVMTDVLRRHGGTIEKFIGDAIMAVFGLPRVHEDDALRATRAALGMTQALHRLNDELEAKYGVRLSNRTGVYTGEVVTGDPSSGQRLVTGDAVNTAARLEQAAPTDEVLLGELTYQLVRAAVEVEAVESLALKGKAERVPAYRLLGLTDAAEGMARRQDGPMVGREAEIVSLSDLHRQARETGSLRLAIVIGDAGVGKSRLIREFVEGIAEEAAVVRGRCLPYGEGITFWPLVDAAREAAAIDPDDAPERGIAKLRSLLGDDGVADRIAATIGLVTAQFGVPEIFWATRRLLERLATGRAVIWVIDDIHWAEQTMLDLIVKLVGEVQAPGLIVCSARHELLEHHPDWASRPGNLRLVLSPLADADAAQIVSNLLGATGISADVRAQIVRAAEGNPLYVEQMLSMLIDSGQLRLADGRWEPVSDVAEIAVPPSIHALLAARLDQLSREERAVVEPASVVGAEFEQAAVEELAPDAVRPQVPAHLDTMARKHLIRRAPSTNIEEASYRFMHLLIRDAAYNGLLKRVRAELHERFAEWADRQNRARHRSQEYEEILGYHLEQAHRYLRELGPLDDHGREVGAQASRLLASAGRRAQARGDAPAAANLLRRAAGTRPTDDPQRLVLLPDLAEALRELGEFREAHAVLREALDGARDLGDACLESKARLVELFIKNYSGEIDQAVDWSSAVAAAVDQALPIFEAKGDEAGLALAWRLRAGMHGMANRYADMAAALEQVMRHARANQDRRTEARSAYTTAIALLYGPTPVSEAIERCEQFAARAASDQSATASIGAQLAQLYSMRGDFRQARALVAAARAKLDELGAGVLAASTSIDSARIELRAGEIEAAEKDLRRGYEALSAMGERFLLSTVGGLLARTLVLQDRDAEAEPIVAAMEAIAGHDDVDAQAILLGVRARLYARRGGGAAARRLAEAAVALRRRSDSPFELADALMDLASVLVVTGDNDGRSAAVSEALQLVEQKGDLATALRLRELSALGGPTAAAR